MNRVAAIDCGTNSIRLLIAEAGPDGGLLELDRRTEIVRLGQGVDATGEFHPDALTRTFAATDAYAALIRDAGVPSSRIRFVATSASRDARNREVFFAGISDRLGVTPEVISGDTEAQLSFVGALSRVRPPAEPVLVIDIGGGSTELIVGTAAGVVASAISLDIGSVRLTERFLSAHPPAPEAVDAGPIAFVRDGDQVTLDVANKVLDVAVDPEEMAARQDGWTPQEPKFTRGVLGKYAKVVQSAAHGAVCG